VITATKTVITNWENCGQWRTNLMVRGDLVEKRVIQVAQTEAVRLKRTRQRKGIQHV
jgi:hypothetical protein